MQKFIIYGDGGSRGNPGEAAYGFVVYDENRREIYKQGTRIGINTNNVAEYSAVINAFHWILNNHPNSVKEISFFLDSLLVASQLSGKFKVKHSNMIPLFSEAKRLELKTGAKVSYTQIPRAQNSAADTMVNYALDQIDK